MSTTAQQSNSTESSITSTAPSNIANNATTINPIVPQSLTTAGSDHSTLPDGPVTNWTNFIGESKSQCTTLDIQKQRLNQLIELISNQETKLNRLKALRKFAKEQTAINAELSNELKVVNNSINEKDGELRHALNRVDNLNRQLNNYRRTKAYRNVSSGKQPTSDNKLDKSLFNDKSDENECIIRRNRIDQYLPNGNGHSVTSDSNNETNNTKDSSPQVATYSSHTQQHSPITLIDDTKNTSSNLTSRTEFSTVIPSHLYLKQANSSELINEETSKVQSSLESVNHVTKSSSGCAHLQNHPSPAINKYTNARQKLIGSGLKSNNGRRVSFDPLALLLDAALEGELDLVIRTSKQVPDLSASHDECVTALHNAVVASHYDVAKYLIDAGCDVNVQDSDGWTPLHCAASCNNLPLVKLLIESGALIYTTTTSDSSTPAMKCEQTEDGFEDCYNYLMYIQNNLGVMNNGVVYALYDYEAQEEDELSFKTNEELVVLRRDDSQEQEWWWAQKRVQPGESSCQDFKEGYIPRNLLGLYPRVKAFKEQAPRTSNGNETTQ